MVRVLISFLLLFLFDLAEDFGQHRALAGDDITHAAGADDQYSGHEAGSPGVEKRRAVCISSVGTPTGRGFRGYCSK